MERAHSSHADMSYTPRPRSRSLTLFPDEVMGLEDATRAEASKDAYGLTRSSSSQIDWGEDIDSLVNAYRAGGTAALSRAASCMSALEMQHARRQACGMSMQRKDSDARTLPTRPRCSLPGKNVMVAQFSVAATSKRVSYSFSKDR